MRAFSAVDATAVEASARRQGDRLGVPIAGGFRANTTVAELRRLLERSHP